jgi:hypothetical protein
MDASFARLVAEGAFEVTAERKKGHITEVILLSRRGASCRILNPWGNRSATLSTEGKNIATMAGEILEFPTQSDMTCLLVLENK